MEAAVAAVAAIAKLCLPKVWVWTVWQCFCEYNNGVLGLETNKGILEDLMQEPSSSSASHSEACKRAQEWCIKARRLIEECCQPWWNLRKRYRLSVDIPIHLSLFEFERVKDHLISERDSRKTPTRSQPDSQQAFESEIWYQEQAVPNSVVGMEETVKNVVEELVSESGNRWVGVLGMGGSGKTTLAKLVNNYQTIQEHFDRKVAWITLGKDSGLEQLKQTLQSKVKLRVSSDSELDTCLKEALGGLKRVLFILDDVWDEGMLEIFDRAVKQPSKVLVTTRKRDVLNLMHAEVFQPHKLTEEESIKLFRMKAFGSREPENLNILGIADQMAIRCGGLPLVVEVTGGCMSAYQDGEVEEWERLSNIFHERAVDLHVKVEDKVLRVLKLSYDDLSHIKQPVNGLKLQECFLYMAAFPEDSRIKLYDLAKCWIGEELVAEDDVVKQIVNCLERRCLVQVEEEYGYEDEHDLHEHLTFLRVHDMVRELCIEICKGTFGWKKHENGCLFGHSLQENVPRKSKYRKVAVHSGEVEAEVTDVILLDGNRSLQPRFLEKLRNLKVLSLVDTGIEDLPNNIWKMTGLTVLDLQDTNLKRIPDHIYGMRKLRYLRVDGSHEPGLNNFRFQNLSMLHDLRLRFTTTVETVDLNGLSSLHHLKVLRLHCSSDDESVMKFPEGLSMLTHLQELRVSGRMDFGSIKLKNLRICDLVGDFLNGDWKPLVMSSTQVKILRVHLFKDSRRRSSSGNGDLSWLENSSQSITVLDILDVDGCHDFFSLPELPQLVELRLSIKSGGAPTTQLSFPLLERLCLVCDDAPHDDLFHAADMKNLSKLEFYSTPRPGVGVWRHLPSSIASLANLKSLSIYHVGMERLFIQTAAVSFSLDFLRIGMSLEYPDELFGPGGFDIKRLFLSVGNKWEHLPQSITMLRSLRELTLDGISGGGSDTLKTMFGDDEGFSSLVELRVLRIINLRGLTRLPHSTALLPHLELVHIWDCPSLKQLCAEEAPDVNDGTILFPSLEHLWLDHGRIIPDWLQNRPGLEIYERDMRSAGNDDHPRGSDASRSTFACVFLPCCQASSSTC